MNKSHLKYSLVLASLFQLGNAVSAQETTNASGSFHRDNSMATYVQQDPSGLHGMWKNADIVVVGVIEGIASEYEFYGDDPKSAEMNRRLPESNPFRFAVPMTELRVKITDVIKDDVRKPLLKSTTRDKSGFGTPETPTTINLRKLNYSPENFDKQVMIFGYLNPDGKSYGIRSFDAELYLEDNVITYYDPTIDKMETPPFARGMGVLEFWNNLSYSVQNDL